MKNLFLAICFAIFIPQLSLGQLTQLAKSNSFAEPTSGFNQSIVMNDGTVCNLSIDKKSGIFLRTWDKNLTQIIAKKLNAKSEHLRLASAVEGLYETNQQIVLFLTEYEGTDLRTYRFVIDPIKAEVVLQDKVVNFDRKNTLSASWSTYKHGAVFPTIRVAYDRTTQNYLTAVVNIGSKPEDRNLTVQTYNNKHEKIKEHIFEWGNKNKYPHIDLQDIDLKGDKVFALLNAFDINTIMKQSGTLILVDCSEPGKSTDFFMMEEQKNLSESWNLIQYSPAEKKVYIVNQVEIPRSERKNEATAFETGNKILIYDVATKQISKTVPIVNKGENDYEKSLRGFALSDKGDYSLSYAITKEMLVNNGNRTYSEYETKFIHIITGDMQGNVKKSSIDIRHNLPAINSSTAFSGRLEYDHDASFKRHIHLVNSSSNVVILNDDKDNEAKIKSGKKPQKLKNIKDAIAYYFNTDGTEAEPSRKPLLDENDSVIMISGSAYNATNGLFVSLAKKNNDKTVKMVLFKLN
jgi:hypothetical protein